MIREIELDLPSGLTIMVEIVDELGNAVQMTKARYDELEAQRELGGTL